MKKSTIVWISFVIFSFFIGVGGFFVFLHLAKPTGWMLKSGGTDLSELCRSDLEVLKSLIINGNVLSVSDLLGNFTAYYHTLISLLIAILMLLAGFVTFSFYRSREEYNDLMQRELNKFFKEYERNLQINIGTKNLEEFEQLNAYLNRQVYEIVNDPGTVKFIEDTCKEAIGEKVLEKL